MSYLNYYTHSEIVHPQEHDNLTQAFQQPSQKDHFSACITKVSLSQLYYAKTSKPNASTDFACGIMELNTIDRMQHDRSDTTCREKWCAAEGSVETDP